MGKQKPKFLETYLDRQKEIEHLLEHTWTGGATAWTACPQSSSSTAQVQSTANAAQQALLGGGAKELIAGSSNESSIPDLGKTGLILAEKTSNVKLNGNL